MKKAQFRQGFSQNAVKFENTGKFFIKTVDMRPTPTVKTNLLDVIRGAEV